MDKVCGVRVWLHGKNPKCAVAFEYPYTSLTLKASLGCENEGCRIGCFKPARFQNPNFGKNSDDVQYRWWLYQYNYAEWLCAEHYDEVVKEAKEYEDLYGSDDDLER